MHAPEPARPAALARPFAVARAIGPAGPLFVVATAGPLVGVGALIATSSVWLDWFGTDLASALGFWLGGALAAALCLLPTHATSLVAGYLFGAALGSMLAWLVVLLAAAVGFGAFRWLVGARVLHAIARSPAASRVHAALLGRGTLRTAWLVALLRLSPVMPFAATNLTFAALGVRGPAFLAGTVVGVTPRAVGAALVGAGLSNLDWSAGPPSWSTWVAIAATLAAVGVIGRLARAALRHEVGDAGPATAQLPAAEAR